MRNDCIFFTQVIVRYGEVDQQGVVYNGNYTAYTDLAFTEFFRSKGHPYSELVEKYDGEICHKKSTTLYNSSAFEGDRLDVGLRILNLGNSSVTIGYEIYRQGEDDILVSSEVVYVGYDTVNRCSRPIAGKLREILSEKN